MIPQIYRSNLPPTDNGRARLLKLYATKENEIGNLNRAVISDTASIVASKTAIASIEKTIQHSRVALNAYYLNLAAIQDIRNRLGDLPEALDLGPTAADESQSLEVCQRVTSFISLNTSSEAQPLQDQQTALETRIANLASMLSSLERELLDWQVGLALNEASLKELQACSSNLTPILSEIKNLLSPIKHVPNEVWLQIFHMVHNENLSQRPSSLRLSYSLILSNVCRKWREVVLAAPKLWQCVDIVPLLWWTALERATVQDIVKRSGGQVTDIFVRLWLKPDWETQALARAKRRRLYLHGQLQPSWRYSYVEPEPGYTGTSRTDLSPVAANFIPQPYSLHLHTRSEGSLAEQVTALVPFRHPQALTIQAVSPRPSASLREMTSSFSGVKQLFLVDIWPTSLETTPINLPDLIYLGLDLHSFKPFDISPLLFPSLEELHIQHDGIGTFQEIVGTIPMSKLHTLSVTLHDYPFCSKLMTPMLRSLILHSSSPVLEPGKALQHFEGEHRYERLTHISFTGWSRTNMEPSTLEITNVLLAKSTQLCQLTFISCQVDGAALLALLRGRAQASGEPSSGISMTWEITILSCTGITQNDCEQIKSQVQKLTVCV